MLADEEIIQKTGGADLSQPIPRNSDCQSQQTPLDPRQSFPGRNDVAGNKHPYHDGYAGQNDSNRPLCQQAQPQTDEQQPFFFWAWRFCAFNSRPEAAHGQSCAQHEGQVCHDGCRGYEIQHGAAEQGDCQLCLAPGATANPVPDEPDDKQGQKKIRQAGGKFIDAKKLEAGRRQPGGQGRLGPKRHAVVIPRGDPVTQFGHLPGDFGIACFCSVRQWVQAHSEQPHKRDNGEGPPQHPAGANLIFHGLGGTLPMLQARSRQQASSHRASTGAGACSP